MPAVCAAGERRMEVNVKILAVETTAAAASAALCEDTHILAEYYTNTKKMHSQTLMPMVEGIFKNCGVRPEDIGLYAVSAGPGSFTGVRIGVSAVKGLAMVRGTPCAGVSTLEVIACNAMNFSGAVCAVMDARCGQVYNALFDNTEGAMARLTPDRAVTVDGLAEWAENYCGRIILVGDGAKLCYNKMKGSGNIVTAPENQIYQRASSVGLLAFRMAAAGRTVDASALEPVYLRPPQAERERLAKGLHG